MGNHHKGSRYFYILLFAIVLVGHSALGQCTITGFSPSPVAFSSTGGTSTVQVTYTGSNCSFNFNFDNIPSWLTVSASGPTSISVTAQNNSTGSSRTHFVNVGLGQFGFTVNQSAGIIPPPTPNAPSIATVGCTDVTIERNGTPPSGVTWYWQGKNSNGTSTAKGSGINFTADEGSGTYYIRAMNSAGWSSGSGSVAVTVPVAVAPPTATVADNCGNSVLTRDDPPSGVVWYWQNTPTGGTSTVNSDKVVTRTNGSEHYLRAYNTDTNCWSTTTTVSYSIKQVPDTPPLPSIDKNCGNTVLTRSGEASGESWYWQSTPSGTNTGNSSNSQTITLNSGTVYYLRARNDATGCWSSARTINYSVDVVPDTPPLPSIDKNCGNTVLTRSGEASGESWYWQSTPSGTNTGNSSNSQTITLNSGTVYYLRARNDATGCWSSARTINYSVDVVPDTPPLPSIDKNCGNTVLTRSGEASGESWYWQSTPSGENTGNDDQAITLNNGTVYYLRARNDATGCWSTARTVNYTVDQTVTWYADTDNDGFGDPNSSQQVCTQPSGYVNNSDDHDDTTDLITNIPPSTFYRDSDGDNFGDPSNSVYQSTMPAGYVGNSDDHDDTTDLITNIPPSTFYRDNDGDTYGDAANTKYESVRPTGYVEDNTDCNDNDVNVHTVTTWYLDADGDGYYTSVLNSCSGPGTGWTNSSGLQPGDCDDSTHSATNDCSTTTDPNDRNYVHTRVYQTEDAGETIESIAYFDGLGRPEQNIAIRAGGSQEDIVTHIAYDNFGRMDKEYLPYASPTQDGAFRTDALSATNSFYSTTKYENTANPYSEKHLENSPLNRVLKQAAPGNPWALNENGADNAIEFDYRSNTANDDVRLFNVDLTPTTVSGTITYEPALVLASTNGGEYEAGELYKTITRDENHSGSTKNHTTEEFRNKQGQVVLKRTYADITGQTEAPHDTYYVYDDYGNLSYVLPPKMNATTANIATINSQMNDLGYRYKYDRRNRLVEKRIPGKGWEYIVYNKLDQPIMTRDANLGAADQWLFTKYDAFGRVAYTGLATDNGTRQAVQAEVDALTGDLWVTKGAATTYGGTALHYGNTAYPTAALTEVYTINYYDDYDFLASETDFSLPAQGFLKDIENHDNLDKTLTKGLATGSRVRVLGTDDWITTVTGYDDKGRAIYTESRNSYLGTTDIVESQLDFTGKPLKVKTRHIKDGTTLATLESFAYDHMGRSESRTQCIGDASMAYSCGTSGNLVVSSNSNVVPNIVANTSITIKNVTITDGTRVYIDPNVANNGAANNMELIALNTYDGLGRLESKKVGGGAAASVSSSIGLQTVDYKYNIRGWLKNINEDSNTDNDLFNFTIRYNNPVNGIPLYNGNISQTSWNTLNLESSTKTYSYQYDALNRITGATDNTGKFNLSNLSYDKNGNIKTLKREGWTVESPSLANNTGFGTMDDLVYSYDNGNRLTNVADDNASDTYGFKDVNGSGTEYQYDINGNMTTDANKGITGITYNHLNLPTNVVVGGGNITYIYDATGVKQKKIVSTGTNTLYAGNFIYEGTSGNESLQFFNHPEGYVEPDGSNYNYVYQYKDHLGNIRLSYQDANNNGSIDASSEIISEKNYYPFGLSHRGYNGNVSSLGNSIAKKYMFGGKEYQDELNLNWYDVSARNYDPALGRWMNLDPMAEQMRRHSPYNYAFDNPVFFTDPDGMMPCPNGDCDDPTPEPIQKLKEKFSFKSIFARAGKAISELEEEIKGSLASAANDIKSMFLEEAGNLDTGADVSEPVTQLTKNDNLKAIGRKAGIIGDVVAITDMVVQVAEAGEVTEEVVQQGVTELVSTATGPVSAATEMVLNDGARDDGVTNTSNMSNNFAQAGRQRNAYIYRNFTMRNGNNSTNDTLPSGLGSNTYRRHLNNGCQRCTNFKKNQ